MLRVFISAVLYLPDSLGARTQGLQEAFRTLSKPVYYNNKIFFSPVHNNFLSSQNYLDL